MHSQKSKRSSLHDTGIDKKKKKRPTMKKSTPCSMDPCTLELRSLGVQGVGLLAPKKQTLCVFGYTPLHRSVRAFLSKEARNLS